MLQHDTSIHLWAPAAEKKWYLITSLDDFSRDLVYSDLWERETSWSHIVAVKTVITTLGCPLKYYVDNHSIFRFVDQRDSHWKKRQAKEEDAIVQWKEVLKSLGIEIVYALSPAAKGKIERPYRWLQDHLVRTCVREGITRIEEAREVLYAEVYQYRQNRIHSTTAEIPSQRFARAVEEKKTLFRPFTIPKPYQTLDDVFCYRFKRRVDAYRRISFSNLTFSMHDVPIQAQVDLKISYNQNTKKALIRFWHKEQLVDQKEVKPEDLKKVHF